MRFAVLLSALVLSVQSHICIIDPHQRGALNISDAGDMTCYKKQAPCGGVASGAPASRWVGGTSQRVLWQQNYNHYEPGYPGFMDIAIAYTANPTSDSDFTTLLSVPDFNAHMQANQQNFTMAVTVPNVACERCTIRMRYAPNKPTENIFYQCADISIVTSQPSWGVFGVQYPSSRVFSPSTLVSVGVDSGDVTQLSTINYNVHKRTDSFPFITDQVATRDANASIIYYTASNSAVLGSIPDILVAVNVHTMDQSVVQLQVGKNPFVALNADSITGELFGLQIVNVVSYFWSFVLNRVSPKSGALSPVVTLPKDDTYVNFQWSDYDHSRRKLFLLAGNENDAIGLTAKLFTIGVDTGAFTVVQVDVHLYTIAGVHYDSVKSVLWALSPGLVGASTVQWNLVSVNPATGSVTQRFNIGSPNQFKPFYGGDVYGGFNPKTRTLMYQFFDYNGFGYLVSIDVNTGHFSTAHIPELAGIHNLVSFV